MASSDGNYIASWEEIHTFRPDYRRVRHESHKGDIFVYKENAGTQKRRQAEQGVLDRTLSPYNTRYSRPRGHQSVSEYKRPVWNLATSGTLNQRPTPLYPGPETDRPQTAPNRSQRALAGALRWSNSQPRKKPPVTVEATEGHPAAAKPGRVRQLRDAAAIVAAHKGRKDVSESRPPTSLSSSAANTYPEQSDDRARGDDRRVLDDRFAADDRTGLGRTRVGTASSPLKGASSSQRGTNQFLASTTTSDKGIQVAGAAEGPASALPATRPPSQPAVLSSMAQAAQILSTQVRDAPIAAWRHRRIQTPSMPLETGMFQANPSHGQPSAPAGYYAQQPPAQPYQPPHAWPMMIPPQPAAYSGQPSGSYPVAVQPIFLAGGTFFAQPGMPPVFQAPPTALPAPTAAPTTTRAEPQSFPRYDHSEPAARREMQQQHSSGLAAAEFDVQPATRQNKWISPSKRLAAEYRRAMDDASDVPALSTVSPTLPPAYTSSGLPNYGFDTAAADRWRDEPATAAGSAAVPSQDAAAAKRLQLNDVAEVYYSSAELLRAYDDRQRSAPPRYRTAATDASGAVSSVVGGSSLASGGSLFASGAAATNTPMPAAAATTGGYLGPRGMVSAASGDFETFEVHYAT